MMRTALLTAIMLCSLMATAQDFLSDYRKISTVYAGISRCSVKVETSLYASVTDAVASQVMHSEVKFNAEGQWVKNEHLEVLYNRDAVLLIDHLKKIVQYTKPKDLKKIRAESNLSGFDTTMLRLYKVVNRTSSGDMTVYELEQKRPEAQFSRIIYKIDAATYRFREIVYHETSGKSRYRKIHIRYLHFDAAPVFGKDEFSGASVLTGKGNQAALTKAYASYKLTNGYTQTLKKALSDD